MFLYAEVLGMAGAYYESKQIPITFPIFIAITALSRLAILQKEQESIELYEAMLAIASYVLECAARNFRNPRSGRSNPAAGQPGGPEAIQTSNPQSASPSPCPSSKLALASLQLRVSAFASECGRGEGTPSQRLRASSLSHGERVRVKG